MKSMFFYFLVLFNFNLFSQTLDPYKFFPASVGNVWEYSYSTGLNRFEIVSDSLLPDSSKYIYYAPNTDPVYRIDTNYNVFWMPTDSVLNWYYYKLDADSGDHWMVRPETSEVQRMEALVKSKYPANFFGHSTTIMEITYYGLNWGDTIINQYAWPRFTMILGYGIGEIMEFDEEGGGPYKILQGCIIDGDTIGIITDLEDEKNIVNSFELFQNYPNPFNPVTTIIYQIKEQGLVQLKVYDLLGQEIVTLLNEIQSSGIYETLFDASNLPSGVYIYSLRVNDFVQNNKMTLLK